MKLDLSADYGEAPGTYSVDLAHTNYSDFEAIEKHFVSLVSRSQVKAREAIARGFQFAVKQCPDENPSDLWHHVIYRLYVQNKKGSNANQSWVRASGDALEQWLCGWYNPLLKPDGIRLALIERRRQANVLGRMGVQDEIGHGKLDVIVEAKGHGPRLDDEGYGIVGAVHVKASLAERVSDDVPASRILLDKKFLSVLCTLDVKSFPPPRGDLVNRGELGTLDKPTTKRRYIEEQGEFSAAFSYNTRTVPSPSATRSGKRIETVDLRANPDQFVAYLRSVAARATS